MTEKLWVLRSCQLFASLSDAELQRLEQRSRSRNFSAGTMISMPNDSAEHVFLLVNGLIKLSQVNADGRESTMGLIAPGELFGELALIDHQAMQEFVHAVSSSTLLMIPAAELREIMESNPQLAFGISKVIGLRRIRIERRLKHLLFTPNRERLIHLLLDLVEQFGVERDSQIRLTIKLSHQEIASIIGITRESVTILLGQLRDEGLIEIGRRKILLKSPVRLANFVHRKLVLEARQESQNAMSLSFS